MEGDMMDKAWIRLRVALEAQSKKPSGDLLRAIRGTEIAEGVYVSKALEGTSEVIVRHQCEKDAWPRIMVLRENEDGPVYWCGGCGFTLGNGEAMAIRLYQVDI